MNYFDTEFIAPEKIKLTNNPDIVNFLALAANVHVLDHRATHTNELETNKKRKKARRKYPDHMETQRFSTFPTELSF